MYTLDNFYKSNKWRDLLTRLKLERVNNDGDIICEYCGEPIVKQYDCIGHHKKELTEANVNDYNISLNPDNIMLVHHRCHNKIHERFGYDKTKKVYLVYGAPCAGKSTWVNNNAGIDDLILSIDNIWQCISNNDRYVKRDRLKQNVFIVRDCILDMIKCRTGKWKNAYIIGGYPMKIERERMERLYNCELIFIDEAKEVCISRAKNKEYINYINEWFDRFTP